MRTHTIVEIPGPVMTRASPGWKTDRTASMRAWVVDGTRQPSEVLELREVEVPEPGPAVVAGPGSLTSVTTELVGFEGLPAA